MDHEQSVTPMLHKYKNYKTKFQVKKLSYLHGTNNANYILVKPPKRRMKHTIPTTNEEI